ncbi:MAG: response regulator [Candidatus Schekmanbacteria bacterium]|nr:response regulator [Candidatus Schekmanbacteria bacterium]
MIILIVDDNSDDREILKCTLERHGHETIEACNGQEALSIAALKKPDIIISDALMPVMDGFQFLRTIKKNKILNAIPFIFYSATYKEYQDAELALSLGAEAFIIKPKDPSELWKEIEFILKENKVEKIVTAELIKEDEEYLKRYSEVVAIKLEEKVRELEESRNNYQKIAESLREKEAFIKNIFETVDEGFIIINKDFKILTANSSFCNEFKLALADIVGNHCYKISHHLDKPCFEFGEACPVKETFETGKPHSSVYALYDESEVPIYIEVKAYPVTDSSNKVTSVIETLNNITEKRKLEEQLRQAQKMEAIGQLAGGIAHDFNNILSAIIGYGNLLEMKMKSDNPLKVNVNHILESAERAASLTHSLLAFSRKQIIEMKHVNLNEVIKRVDKFLARIIGEDIDLSMKLSETSLNIMADAGQIEQVLMNIAANARDAMPQGGKLSIETESVELDEIFIKAHGYGEKGNYALISVSDTGIGMDEKTQKKIFEPFFTTKETGKGTGLGLSIVYGIIKQHNGYINVYSEPGQGTTFKIYLPAITAKEEEKQTAIIQPVMPTGSETILVAEDNETVRELMSSMLETFGYKVMTADDGQDAIIKFTEDKDKIDLVILDLIMPKKNGREAYNAIKKIKPAMKFIFMSGYTADKIYKDGYLEEGSNYILKPFSPRDFLIKVRDVLDKA